MNIDPPPNSECRPIVTRILESGRWEQAGRDGQQHGRLRHIDTGQTISYPCHAKVSDRNAVRSVAKSAEKIDGGSYMTTGVGRSRKSTRVTPFDPRKSGAEYRAAETIARLTSEYRHLVDRLTPNDKASARRVLEIESELQALYQPPPMGNWLTA